MRNKIQASIPFLTSKITGLIRRKWATKADSMRMGDAIRNITGAIQSLVDNLTSGDFSPHFIKIWSVPAIDDFTNMAKGANEDLENAALEGQVVSDFIINTELLTASSVNGLTAKALDVVATLDSVDHGGHFGNTLAFKDDFNNLTLSDPGLTKDVSALDGALTLSADDSLDPLSGNIASITVESQGDPGSVREVYLPAAGTRDISDQSAEDFASNIASSDGANIENRGTVQYYSEVESVSSDPMVVFGDGEFFEVACIDLKEYTVPVKILHPFTIYAEPTNDEALVWGEALIRVDDSEKETDVSVFRYTSSPNQDAEWPEDGYGWTYLVTDQGTPVRWIGQPKDRAVSDISGDIVNIEPARDNNSLHAVFNARLTNPVEVPGITIDLAHIPQDKGRGKSFFPNLSYVELMNEDGTWFRVTGPWIATPSGVIKVFFDKRMIYGVRFELVQEWSYSTKLGHPYVAQEIILNPVKQKDRSYPAASIDDYTFIIRLPLQDSKRPDMPVLDWDGRIGKINVFDSPDKKDTIDVLKIEDASVNVVYGDDVFDAERWAIRVDRVRASQDTYLESGEYTSLPIETPVPIKSVRIEVVQDAQDQGAVSYFVLLPGSDNEYRIFPENTAKRTDGSTITRYVFDPAKEVGNFTKYIETNESVKSLRIKIRMSRGSDVSISPAVRSYTAYIEV